MKTLHSGKGIRQRNGKNPVDRNILLKKTLALLLGGVFFTLGIIGLVLPILPGILFLLLSLLCFAETSPRLAATVANWHRNIRVKWRGIVRPTSQSTQTTGSSIFDRVKLFVWKGAARVMGLSDRRRVQ